MSQLSFYFTAGTEVLNQGEIEICARDARSGEVLASASYDLADLGEEAFWGVTFENEPVGQAMIVSITGKNREQGPYIWLKTESETTGSSYEDGQQLERNLIYNAVYRTQVHYVKKPLLTTAMLLLLGALFFLVWRGKGRAGRGADGASRCGEPLPRQPAAFPGQPAQHEKREERERPRRRELGARVRAPRSRGR